MQNSYPFSITPNMYRIICQDTKIEKKLTRGSFDVRLVRFVHGASIALVCAWKEAVYKSSMTALYFIKYYWVYVNEIYVKNANIYNS